MKKGALVLLFLSTFFLFSCVKDEVTPPVFVIDQPDQLQSDEYEVYGIILRMFHPSQVIVRQQTSVHTPPKENFELFFNQEEMSNMEAVLYARYVEANVRPYLLDEKIEIPAKDTKLLSNEEYAYYFDREDLDKAWGLFRNKYPDAGAWFFSLNKIGFNEDGTQAIVGMESYWFMDAPEGPTVNGGRLYYLEKKDGEWEYVASTAYQF